jgi:adenylate kinase
VAEIIDINSIAIEEGAILKKTGRGLDVDVKRLTGQLGRLLRSKDDLVIVGHLAPYVLKPAGIDMAAVLRRSPYELQKTLEGRQYDYSKVRENVSSEILGVSFYDSVKAFGKRKVAEFDTTGRTPEQTADEIVATLRGKSPKRTGFVDWLALISEKDDIQKFFDY